MPAPKSPFLTGQRIYLRPHTAADIDTWFDWFNDDEVTRFLEHAYYPNTRTLQLKRLKQMYTPQDSANLQLAVVERRSGRLVGTVGLHRINLFNRNAEVSVVIGNKKVWGRRYGEQAVGLLVDHAFSKLNLHKVNAGMVASNTASYRLFKRLGFQREAILKEQLFIEGKFQDSIRLALFKRKWALARAKSR